MIKQKFVFTRDKSFVTNSLDFKTLFKRLSKSYSESQTIRLSLSSTMLLILAFVCLAVALFYWQRVRRMSVLARNGIPGPPPHLLFGNMSDYNTYGYNECFEKWKKQYGRVFGYYLGAKPFVVVTDPELLKLIQIKDFQHFTQRPYVIPGGIYHNWKYHQMVTRVDSLRWKKMRTLLSPWFSSMHLKANTPVIEMCVKDMIERVDRMARSQEEFNIYERVEAATIDIIDRTGFSIQTDIQDRLPKDNPFFEATRGVFNIRPQHNLLASLLLCLPELAPLINAVRDVCETVWDHFGLTSHGLLWSAAEAIVRRRLTRGVDENNNALKALDGKRKDLLGLMLDVRNNTRKGEEKTLNDVEIVANTVVLHEAAYESPANLVGFAIHHLVNHPDVQRQCAQEVDRLFERDAKLDFNVMSDSLPVLDAVINETFRLYPTDTIFTSRMSGIDYKYKDLVIPRGVDIRVPTVQLHRDPEYWPEPSRFDIGRFLSKSRPIDPIVFQPFGVGPRVCPGKRFGLLEIKLILANILKDYELVAGQRTETGELELDFKLITCSPKNGIFVKLSPK